MLGKYAGFIVPAYAATIIVIGGLTAWIVISYRRRQAEIRALEARGIKRGASSR